MNPMSQSTGRTILVVDDQDEVRTMIVRVLAGDGYVVHEAADEAVLFSFSDRPVQHALHLFREKRHDV